LVPAPELAARSARALAAAGGGWLPAEAVHEARLAGAWIAQHRPPALELRAGMGAAEHAAFLSSAGY
jgi:hypothetical protein